MKKSLVYSSLNYISNRIKKSLPIFLLVSCSFTFFSCKKGVFANFEIKNDTPFRVDSLLILSNKSPNNFISLNPNETKEYNCDMSNITIDGSYRLSYKLNDRLKIKNFGYFSNGIPGNYMTKINIKSDTIIIKEIF